MPNSALNLNFPFSEDCASFCKTWQQTQHWTPAQDVLIIPSVDDISDNDQNTASPSKTGGGIISKKEVNSYAYARLADGN